MLGPIGSENILLNLNRNQENLGNLTSRLASGLRIQTAADDPSGLAISENFRSHIAGLQQSVENVQTGRNLLTVADGAAGTIQQILQRIRSLIVESNSDLNSNAQLAAIQAEIDQGLLEVNRISSNANFNGLTLFDGSHDTYVAPNPFFSGGNAFITATLVNAGIAPNGDIATPIVANSQTSSPYLIDPTQLTEVSGQELTGLFVTNVSQYDPTTTSVTLGFVLYSSQGSQFGNAPESIQSQALYPTNAGPASGLNFPSPSGLGSINNITVANISPQDAGPVSEAIYITTPRASGGGTAININDGGQEGSTIAISLPTLSTNALQISGISVLRPLEVDPSNNVVGQDQSNQWAAMDALIRTDNALDQISQVRAQIGAQAVSTQEDANNDNIAIVNYQATESSIRDLNIGTATTEFTREQILTSVGTSVLAQSEVSARQLTALLISALVA